jgi:alkaline phosphatase
MGKKLRFWNAPDTINAWYELMNARVDYINTDHIDQAAQFMRQLPKRTAVAGAPYKLYTPTYKNDGKEMLVKNIILIIGDGMGLAQLYAGYTANKAALQTFLMRFTGLSKTSSADSYVTDSAPGSTAFSSGEKTNNRSVGVDANGKPLLLLPAILKQHQKLTGLITCGDITDATPADFYAHQAERSDSRLIVKDLQNAPIQLLMGAGNKSIDASLPTALPAYRVVHHLDSIAHNTTSRWVLTEERAGKSVLNGRGNWLQQAFGKAVAQLSSGKAGFFLMVEGAQVDYGGHANDLSYVVAEVQDLDRVVADAMKFADGNGETLVIVTADHETGGLTLLNGNYATASVSGQFATNDHTATPVPVFAYGPMAQLFTGVYENTAIFGKMLQAMRIKIQ